MYLEVWVGQAEKSLDALLVIKDNKMQESTLHKNMLGTQGFIGYPKQK